VPVVIPPERFKNDTVIHKIIQQDGKNIGYLWLLDFNNAATPLIQDAFKAFKLQGIEELVLDLRYNGGGHNDEALADLIAGASYEGKVYSRWKFSDKYRDEDSSIVFHRQPNSIPLKRVFVLMTHQTCSASELIINGLRPYMPIITIGEKSCGKPFFMRPITYAGYVYDPVTGRVLNSDGGADYEQGIEPDCKVLEDFSKPIGEVGDTLLDTALYFQKNNTCSTTSL
jgi:C-terminal processing protease CtpA/Prc